MATPLRAGVLIAPFTALILVFIAGWVGFGPRLQAFAEESLAWLMQSLGWLFTGIGLVAVVMMALLYGVLNSIRIGGTEARRGHGSFTAIAIGVAASTSLGLLFWATAEPLYHAHQPPSSLRIPRLTEEAAIFARYAAVFHWAIIANVMNALCMVVFGLTIHNLGRSQTLDGVVFRAEQARSAGSALDGFLVFFASLMAVGALASCTLALSGEMSRFGSLDPNPAALFALALALVFVIFVAGARPIRTVYAILARAGLVLMIVMMVVTAIIGPSGDILGGGLKAIWQMILSLPSMLTFTGLSSSDPWPQTWTMTHWGNAMMLAPLTGLFLSRAARGFPVGDAVFYFSVVPAIITMLWVLVFGGLALSVDEASSGSIWAAIARGGADDAAYTALWSLPGGESLMVGFVILIALAFTTYAAALLHAVMRICAPGLESAETVGSARASVAMIWCAGIGIAGWGLASYGVNSVVETLARLGSLPALLVTVGFLIAALRLILSPSSLMIAKEPDPVQIELDLGEMIADGIDEIESEEAVVPRRRKRRKSA